MHIDDIIYLLCLLACIGFGKYYRSIKDVNKLKLIGSGFGLLLLFIVSGLHGVHCLLSFAICAIAIIHIHPSKSHLVCFFIMFGYLVFFRTVHWYGLPNVPGHTNMIQMILTIKMTGVAFEKNTSFNKFQQRNKEIAAKKDKLNIESDVKDESTTLEKHVEITEYDAELQNITFTELFHYAFNYIGFLTGPYYRYRTFRDYFETSFKNYADCKGATLNKLKNAVLYSVLYLISSNLWPHEYASEPEFYEERSWIYRLWYVWPIFFIFRMRIYIGLTLSECVCTNAGFGAYPEISNACSGEGPKEQYLHLKRNADTLQYNFNTIFNIDAYSTEVCWTFREAMKHWNICIQHWLALNIYKRFPSRKYRTIAVLLVSSFWHGMYPGHYMCLMGAPFVVPVEDIYNKIIRKDATGLKRRIIDCMFWFSKFFMLSYFCVAFILLTFDKIWYYYSSVYHFAYCYYVVMLIGAIVLMRQKKAADRKKRKLESGTILNDETKKQI